MQCNVEKGPLLSLLVIVFALDFSGSMYCHHTQQKIVVGGRYNSNSDSARDCHDDDDDDDDEVCIYTATCN